VLDCALGRFETGGRPHLLLTFADITERKRAGVLRRQLSTIIESTSDFVATASPEGKLLYFNRTARQMFGLGDDTDPAAWSIEQSHPAWAAKRVLEEGFPAAVRDGTWTGETAFLTHDRREIPHTQVLIAHKAADGSLEMISTVARDISARKRSEELMQARLRLMEAAPAATLDGFLQLALDEIEARTNSTIGFYHFMGADQETLTLQAWSTNTIRHMCTAEGKGSHYAVSKAGVWVDCVRERRPVIHNDYAALAHKKGLPEGHSPIVRELVVPIIRGERIVAIIGVGNKSTGYDQSDVEITTLLGDFSWESVERKRAELRLLEVSRLQKAILDGAGVGIVSATTEGRITTFSTGAEKLLGHAREAMIGINTPVVYHLPNEIQARANELTVSLGEPVAADFAVFAALPRRGQPDEREWTFVRKDGSPVPVWQSITALHDPAGAITGFLSIAQDLTERKRADVALQLSEERLRKVLGQADCLVWEAKVHLTADDWSWRFTIHPSGLYQQLFGEQEPNQSAGLWYQFEIPEQQEMNRRSRQAMESGVPGYVQIFRVIREGRMRWIRESVSITRRESGHCWLVGVATDVTEQKRAEELLKAEENLFRTLMDTSLDRVYFKDLEGRFTRVNQSKLVRHGFTDFSQIIGKTDLETGGGEQARQAHQDEAEIIRTGQPLIDREEYAVYPDGTPCWISSYKYPLRDATGRIIGTFGISRDITLRKLAEVELQQSLSQLQATLQSTADGILVVNSAGRITLYNQRFLEFGRIPDGMLESDDDAPVLLHIFSQMKHPEAFLARVKAIYAAPGCDSTDLLELKDGRIFERYSRPQLVDGHPAGRVWSFRDVTLERQAEAAKEKLLGELSRSNTDLEQFAYVASHDLKSPLRAIDSLAGWLQEDLAEVLVGDSRKHLDLLRQRTRRMERLLDDLLAYSRAGRVPADIVRVDVARLLAEIVEMIGAPAGFVVQARPPLPVFATAVTPLRQVLTNLIANAIKHHDRPAGGIELAVREAGEWYEFTVADDGPGIAPEFHERIFGMFQTLRPRDEVEGSGIGLALVRRIVTRYGGTAEVECRQPRGSRFRFTWPRQIPTDDSHFA